jgi:hypothetical protein
VDDREADRLLKHLAARGADVRAGCPDAERIAACAEGALLEEEARAVREHAADCERCRGVLDALGRESTSPARSRRRVAWIALAAAALLLAAGLWWDPLGWRSADEIRVDAPAIVLASRGDVRSGTRALRFGDAVDAGERVRLGPDAAVAMLERGRVVSKARGRERAGVDAPAAWTSGAERRQSLDGVRAVRRGASPANPLRLLSPVGAVVDARPTLRWDGGAGHATILVRGGGTSWQQSDVGEREIAFPESLPSLEVGQEWVWQATSGSESASAPFRRLAAADVDRIDAAIRRATDAVRSSAAGDDAERGVCFLEISMLRGAELLDRADAAARAACERFPDDRVLLEEWALVRRDRGEDESARDLAERAETLR